MCMTIHLSNVMINILGKNGRRWNFDSPYVLKLFIDLHDLKGSYNLLHDHNPSLLNTAWRGGFKIVSSFVEPFSKSLLGIARELSAKDLGFRLMLAVLSYQIQTYTDKYFYIFIFYIQYMLSL